MLLLGPHPSAILEGMLTQVALSLVDRRPLHTLRSYCQQHDIALVAYGVLAGGFLSAPRGVVSNLVRVGGRCTRCGATARSTTSRSSPTACWPAASSVRPGAWSQIL